MVRTAAGCKGAILEDQQWPKRAGHMQIKECIAMEEVSGCMGGPHADQRVHSHGGGE